MSFDYDGSVSLADSKEILDQASALHCRVLGARENARSEERSQAPALFAASLSRAFYDFEPDFFQQNVSRIVSDEVGRIRSSLEIWPTLLEIVYFQKRCRMLPLRLVKNRERLSNGKHAA